MSECYGSATLFYGFCLDEDFVTEMFESNEEFDYWFEGNVFKECSIEKNGNENKHNCYVSTYSITTNKINPTEIKNLHDITSPEVQEMHNKSLTNFAKYFKIPNISKEDFGWFLIADYGR